MAINLKLVLVATIVMAMSTAGVSATPPVADQNLPASVSLLKSAVAPRLGCPLCDSSVYSYCSNKLFHDACCCRQQGQFGYNNCPPTNCNYLHANSCYEHSLIVQCCCNNYLR